MVEILKKIKINDETILRIKESKLKVDTLINMTSNDYKIFNINISEAVVVHIRNFLISEKEKGVELMEVETTTSDSDTSIENSENNKRDAEDEPQGSKNKKSKSGSENAVLTDENRNTPRLPKAPQFEKELFQINMNNVSAEAVKKILRETYEGQSLLGASYKKEPLTPHESLKLSNLLVNRSAFIERSTNEFFKKLDNAIRDLMPSEPQDLYYIPASGKNKNFSGHLVSVWRTLLRSLRKNNVICKKSDSCNDLEIVEEEELNSTDCLEWDDLLGDDVKASIEWLKNYRDPLDEVKKHYKGSEKYRLMSFKNNQFDFIFDEEWPILKSNLGPLLILEDYKNSFQTLHFSAKNEWTLFFDFIYNFASKSLRDKIAKEYAKKYNEYKISKIERDLDGLRVVLLPYLMPVNHNLKIGNKTVRPSVADIAKAFFIHSKDNMETVKFIEARSAYYEALNETAQPCIILEGDDLTDVTYFTCFNDWLWTFDALVPALDFLFHLYMLFDIKYPQAAYHIWLMIQRHVYKLITPLDCTNIPSVVKINSVLINNYNKL